MAADQAWSGALASLGGGRGGVGARRAVRALLTLSEVSWRGSSGFDAPRSRMHPVFASCCDGQCLVMFGGRMRVQRDPHRSWQAGSSCTSDAYAYDVPSEQWHPAATIGPQPLPRVFSSDDGGARVLRDTAGTEWLCLLAG